MPLVLGVDSSTQSTKVEVRDADTGALVAVGRAPHPPTTPPRSEQDPERVVGRAARGACRRRAPTVRRRRRGRRCRPAARPGRARRRRRGDPAGQALERHRVGARRALAGRAARPSDAGAARRVGDGVRIGARRRVHDHQAVVAAPLRARRWARVARVCLPHDWLTWKLTGELVTDRGDASGTGYFSAARDEYRLDLLAIVDADVDWSARLPRVLGPVEAAGTTRGVRVGRGRRARHRRQHGRRARARAASRATSRSRSARRAPCTR